MNCITVFVVNQEEQLKNLMQETKEILSHRMFILNNFDIDKKRASYILSTDVIVSYNFSEPFTEEIMQRMALMYTDPIYEKIIIPIETFTLNDIEDAVDKEYLSSSKLNNLLVMIREDVVLHGVNFKNITSVSENILEEADSMFAAMTGQPVNEEYFNKALEDIILQGSYDFSNVSDMDKVKFLEKYSSQNSSQKVKIYYNPSNQITDNFSIVVIDNHYEIENYAFVLKRLDGLCLYII